MGLVWTACSGMVSSTKTFLFRLSFSCETERFRSSMIGVFASSSIKLKLSRRCASGLFKLTLLVAPRSTPLGLGLLRLPTCRFNGLGLSTETKLARTLDVGRPSALLFRLTLGERLRGSGEGEDVGADCCLSSNMARSLPTPAGVPLPCGFDMTVTERMRPISA